MRHVVPAVGRNLPPANLRHRHLDGVVRMQSVWHHIANVLGQLLQPLPTGVDLPELHVAIDAEKLADRKPRDVHHHILQRSLHKLVVLCLLHAEELLIFPEDTHETRLPIEYLLRVRDRNLFCLHLLHRARCLDQGFRCATILVIGQVDRKDEDDDGAVVVNVGLESYAWQGRGLLAVAAVSHLASEKGGDAAHEPGLLDTQEPILLAARHAHLAASHA
mmetsp:Transcript_74177/g.208224  ORF Transcript_74177/g.208224 Transcript_74177/m.208224 type:complete len:219 (-) Transcript_74177:59-715(-)